MRQQCYSNGHIWIAATYPRFSEKCNPVLEMQPEWHHVRKTINKRKRMLYNGSGVLQNIREDDYRLSRIYSRDMT